MPCIIQPRSAVTQAYTQAPGTYRALAIASVDPVTPHPSTAGGLQPRSPYADPVERVPC